MGVPDYQTLMLPLLRATADGVDHRIADLIEKLAAELRLTEEERISSFSPARGSCSIAPMGR